VDVAHDDPLALIVPDPLSMDNLTILGQTCRCGEPATDHGCMSIVSILPGVLLY
jgi:hypothetical protein